MTNIEIYTTNICPYCERAKRLLEQKGVQYQEINISQDPALREAMTERAGGRTGVPQIFIAGKHIGGCDDLYALDRKGELAVLLV